MSFLKNIYNLLKFGVWTSSNEDIALRKNLKMFLPKGAIFIHIPKAAGISFQKGIFKSTEFGHVKYSKYETKLGSDRMEKLFKFTIMRNPYTRLESAYDYLKTGGRKAKNDLKYQNILTKYSDYSDFVLNFFNDYDLQDFEHFQTQFSWFKSLNGKSELDFIGKYENLQNDFNFIKNKLGILNNEILPFDNKTGKKVEKIYTTEMINIINLVYKEDFLIGNYKMRE
ncbi:sulfotransferase family 2 domain-containing protein [Lacihabitans lacunae]|uniref:Sulfotransferase family 2 domain-containing protein n=1 Tax=Lacihabitans lacunae TaxID=1028214 RepID=A0ABV7YTW0_9BACT